MPVWVVIETDTDSKFPDDVVGVSLSYLGAIELCQETSNEFQTDYTFTVTEWNYRTQVSTETITCKPK